MSKEFMKRGSTMQNYVEKRMELVDIDPVDHWRECEETRPKVGLLLRKKPD